MNQDQDTTNLVECNDCNQLIHPDEGIEWKPFDFNEDPRIADEVLFICHDCCGEDEHILRVEEDLIMKDAIENEDRFDEDSEDYQY